MARISRKKESSVKKVENDSEILSTAIYARLSIENNNGDDGDVLVNQIVQCEQFVSENPDLKLIDTYIDNGTTGTAFDRKEFKRLMDDIRIGRIECLVVRDLSRFGRDYIEVGTYMERIFPQIGLRFISVKEMYDSNTNEGGIESLTIPLQNMINDFYSKDISRKVSSVLRAKIDDGTMAIANLAYGYMWNGNRTEIIEDVEVSRYVRDIFRWKLEGVSITQMVRNLNEANAPTCDIRKYQNGVKTGTKPKGGKWGQSSVMGILRNQFYIGDTVRGKMELSKYKGMAKAIKIDENKWKIQEQTHIAIVERDVFWKVQGIMNKAEEERRSKIESSKIERDKVIDRFKDKMICKECGKKLYIRKKEARTKGKGLGYYVGFYECTTYTKKMIPACTSHAISMNRLEKLVLNAINNQVLVAVECEKLLSLSTNYKNDLSVLKQRLDKIESEIKRNQLKRKALYEDYINTVISIEEYQFTKEKYDFDYKSMDRQYSMLQSEYSNKKRLSKKGNDWNKLMRMLDSNTKLSRKLIDKSIDKIYIYEDKSIEIVFKYQDIFKEIYNYVGEGNGESCSLIHSIV